MAEKNQSRSGGVLEIMSTNGKGKQLGDAGEHFVAGMLGLSGYPTIKMPDNWPDFDLTAYVDGLPLRVQVKTYRKLTQGSWNAEFPPIPNFDYLVIVEVEDELKAWIIPVAVVNEFARKPIKDSTKNRNHWIKTTDLHGELSKYRNKWDLISRTNS